MPIARLAPGDEHLLYMAGTGGARQAALCQTLPALGPQEGQHQPSPWEPPPARRVLC